MVLQHGTAVDFTLSPSKLLNRPWLPWIHIVGGFCCVCVSGVLTNGCMQVRQVEYQEHQQAYVCTGDLSSCHSSSQGQVINLFIPGLLLDQLCLVPNRKCFNLAQNIYWAFSLSFLINSISVLQQPVTHLILSVLVNCDSITGHGKSACNKLIQDTLSNSLERYVSLPVDILTLHPSKVVRVIIAPVVGDLGCQPD